MRLMVCASALLAMTCVSLGCTTSKCEQICEAANECAPSERAVDVECIPFCQDVEQFNKDTGCAKEWDDHLTCWTQYEASICEVGFMDCADTGEYWLACVDPYCFPNGHDEGVETNPDPNCFLAPF